MWRRNGFDVYKRLKMLKGPMIEIAGPTKSGYRLVDWDKLNRRVYVTNIFPGLPMFRNGKMTIVGSVDFVADGRKLPINNNELSAVFCSCIGGVHFADTKMSKKLGRHKSGSCEHKREKNRQARNLRICVIAEAWRVLEPGGILVWQGGRMKGSMRFAKRIGFIPMQGSSKSARKMRSCIFEKPF